MKKDSIILKILFYFISLWLLFLSISTISLNIKTEISFEDNLKKNIASIIFAVLALVSFILRKAVDDITKGTTNPPFKIISVKNKNFEFLTYLTTYIIPLAFIEFNKLNHIIVLLIIIVYTGFVFTKMDLFLANPTLALFYKLYEIEVKDGSEVKKVTVISKDKLMKNDYIEWKPFDDNNWFVRRKEDENSKKTDF